VIENSMNVNQRKVSYICIQPHRKGSRIFERIAQLRAEKYCMYTFVLDRCSHRNLLAVETLIRSGDQDLSSLLLQSPAHWDDRQTWPAGAF